MDERTIFVLDGIGAMVSVLLLGVVLPHLHGWIGMPIQVLRWLTLWPVCCLLYDVYCYGFADLKEPRWLRGIMFANAAYCPFTMLLVVLHFSELTTLGVLYFLLEVPVILGLVYYEQTVFRRAFPSSGVV